MNIKKAVSGKFGTAFYFELLILKNALQSYHSDTDRKSVCDGF